MDNNTEIPVSLDDVPLPQHFPPIVLIAFTRPDLLQEVLIGLSKQSLLPKKIIAFVDGARNESDAILIEKCILLLQDFSSTIPVEINARSSNLGCDRNVILSLTEVLSSYDSLVYLEDDNVPNCYFYDRICRLLEAYRKHKQVFSVSAYANFPQQVYESINTDFAVSNRVFGWGWGIWADRWKEIGLLDKPQQYNPFGCFYKIPATLQTKMTIVNQFWLEKNNKTDWIITMTLAALSKRKVHIVPVVSFTRNIGFGHPQAKTYNQGKEPSWVNARYDDFSCPKSLPLDLELQDCLASNLKGVELTHYLFTQRGLWLSPAAMFYFLRYYPEVHNIALLFKFFIARLPIMLQRLRNGLPI